MGDDCSCRGRTFQLTTNDGDLDLSIYDTSTQDVLEALARHSPKTVTLVFTEETEVYVQVDGFNEQGLYTLSWQ